MRVSPTGDSDAARRRMESSVPRYDRDLLLSGVKRNAVLELAEVQRYGVDSYGDPDYVSVYGLRPGDWHAKGVRLLGRTVVECTRDPLGDAIGRDVARVAAGAVSTTAAPVIVDPFVGSANTLYWLLHHVPRARGLGFELDDDVFRLSRQNMTVLGLPIDIRNTGFEPGLANLALAPDHLLIAFIAPPWGEALDRTHGLDLRRTTPPVPQIVDILCRGFARNRLLCAVQVHESVDPDSLDELKARLDWSALRIYDLTVPGENHGILLGTKGWTPAQRLVEGTMLAGDTR